MYFKILCIIPTLNGFNEIRRLHESLIAQDTICDLIVVDSGSADGTLDYLYEKKINFISISSGEFNHGGTRQMMIDCSPNYDIYIFLTQDAYLENKSAIKELVRPFLDTSIGAVCGRQLPHLNANLFAAHARVYNYPDVFIIRRSSDIPELGLKAAFLSNSFSAYRRDSLMQIGGFPRHLIFGEDMYVAAKMIINGWGIAYASSAICRHSHNYSIMDEFRRYFDMGVFHSRERWISTRFGGISGEGFKFLLSEMKYVGIDKFYIWPNVIFRNGCKYVAYNLGKREKFIPFFAKKYLGMHKAYWIQEQRKE